MHITSQCLDIHSLPVPGKPRPAITVRFDRLLLNSDGDNANRRLRVVQCALHWSENNPICHCGQRGSFELFRYSVHVESAADGSGLDQQLLAAQKNRNQITYLGHIQELHTEELCQN